jgi:hypothetical protein
MELQYIRCTARGDRWWVAKIASESGAPFVFVREIRIGDFVKTVGRVELSCQREMAVCAFRKNNARSEADAALLAYAATTDDRELAREAAHAERIETAKRELSERANRARRRPLPAARRRGRPSSDRVTVRRDSSRNRSNLVAVQITRRNAPPCIRI